MAEDNPRKFEDELADLERIVGEIDTGELSLEESIAAFERGIALVRSLNQKLEDVERRVEVLVRDSRGELKRSPYQGDLARDNESEGNDGEDA